MEGQNLRSKYIPKYICFKWFQCSPFQVAKNQQPRDGRDWWRMKHFGHLSLSAVMIWQLHRVRTTGLRLPCLPVSIGSVEGRHVSIPKTRLRSKDQNDQNIYKCVCHVACHFTYSCHLGGNLPDVSWCLLPPRGLVWRTHASSNRALWILSQRPASSRLKTPHLPSHACLFQGPLLQIGIYNDL